ncbi:MAG: Uma2 family endonuclease [Chloroflexota bacterium]
MARSAGAIRRLENGDRLTRAEFERRYEAMPNLKKAELIEGVVYVPSPVRLDQHGAPHAAMVGWAVVYSAATPGIVVGDNATVRLDLDNEPQPDVLLRAASHGRSTVDPDGYVEGAPELVVEIAASSVSYDLHAKLAVYRRSGVREYVVWRVLDDAIDWFVLTEGEYVRTEPDSSGICRSQVFPGLWLNVPAMLAGDLSTALQTLNEGLASPEHGQFLAERGGSGQG